MREEVDKEKEEDAEDEAVERFLSHGMRELPSGLGIWV